MMLRRPGFARGVAAVTAIALGALYAPVVLRLTQTWLEVPANAYGLFVPVWSGWLLWERRAVLRATPFARYRPGLAVGVLGLLVLALGARTGALTLEALSIPIVLAGAGLFALGPAGVAPARFPLAFLALMTPLPATALAAMSRPLQHLAAFATHVVLVLLGIPVYRDGLLLHMSSVTLAVTEACSGLRFLLAMAVVGPALAWAVGRAALERAAIVGAALGMAIAGNLVRVAGTAVLAQHFGPAAATGLFHVAFGKVVYLAVLVPLALALLLLRRRPARPAAV